MKTKKVSIPVDQEQVSGILSLPDPYGGGTGIIIAHGAGNDMNNPLIVHVAEGLADAGYLTLRFNFPYKEKGRKAPNSQKILVQTWKSVHQFFIDKYEPNRIVAAGKSMGGRIASQMVAEGLLPVDSLLFLGYPLHAPNKKDKLRDAHLYGIKVPMLFFSGTRDSLCDLDLLKNVLEKLNAPWALEVIEGGNHSFNILKSMGVTEQEVYNHILKKITTWL